MGTQPTSGKARPVPETVMRMIRQADAAAAGQNDSARSTTQDALVHGTDLTTAEPGEDYVPPPAYGETYGEIRGEKNGLGTSASVTDDGRVNIRINQLNRRLSQILTPALRQHVQSVEDSRPPPPPYIPPSLGGEEGVPPPPPLNVVIQVVGTRGDVQPFIALGKVLKETYGHRVRLATHPNFKDFVQDNGLEFFSIGGDPSRLMAFMVKNPGLMPGFRSLISGDVGQRKKDVAEYIQGCWRSCYQAGDGLNLRASIDDLSDFSESEPGSEPAARHFVADCIIANPPSFAHIHCAEKLGIPLHIMFTMPYSPTQAFPHPLANVQSSNADPQLTNYLSYAMIEVLSWQGLGEIINRFRARCLGLDPISLVWGPGMLQRLKIPHTYCWSPALVPKPKDWGAHISIPGFYFLDLASKYTPTPDLQAFLDAGPPPVYIGFGSIVLSNPNAMTELIFEAVRKTGQRVLLSKGWGGMGADELQDRIPDGVFMLANVPHDWLFKHVSCVIHHGGAGTTAAGITAGRPTFVVPFFGDQPFWGAMIARVGAGPDPVPHKQLTAEKLADAIDFCLKPESLARAKELASRIAAERGCHKGAQSFHQYLEVDRLRCALAPSRPAAWRVRRTQVRLSAFAACTLANANLLDFSDLKLFRPQEYETDEGPWDPISGGFVATCGAFSSMAMGLADFPSETFKALQLPFKYGRQQSQASVSTIPGKREFLSVGERSNPPTSPAQRETSLSVQQSLTRIQSQPNPSDQASPSSNGGSNSISDGLEIQLSSKQDEDSRSLVHSVSGSSSSKDRDMVRPTGVHTSKGLGRFTKALVQSPMTVSMSLTKGFHNLPKHWGDETVRPQAQVTDFASGAKMAGKKFGLGFYDGVTGLVTQPWRGAQKEGTSGFIKGIGKGMGGLVAKPGAAVCGIPGYMMKGVHKEVQKLLGSNVQDYIVASRAAQGYEEWRQSSDAEKQDVIVRWKLVQKYLKKKRKPDEVVRDVLDAQRKMKAENRESQQIGRRPTSSARSANSVNASTQDPESARRTMDGTQFPLRPTNSVTEESLGGEEISGIVQLSAAEGSWRDAEQDATMERAMQGSVSHVWHQGQDGTDHHADEESLRQAMVASKAEAQRHAREALEYEKQLRQVMAQSLREQRQSGRDDEWESNMDRDDEEPEIFELYGDSPELQRPYTQDSGHLAGTTQRAFEAQQLGQQGEKTAQERTEEEIVMEYIKKQSLLEVQHRGKGKGRARTMEDEDDEDLQKVLKLSMQGHEIPDGEASGA